MVAQAFNILYLGRFEEMDTFEGDIDNENDNPLNLTTGVNLLNTTYDSSNMSLVNVTLDDIDNDGLVEDNDQGNTAEELRYSLDGTTTTTTTLDATTLFFSATITLGDGTVFNNVPVFLLQAENGDVFIHDLAGNNPNLAGANIQSVTLGGGFSDGRTNTSFAITESYGGVVCFAAGTLIRTSEGERPIERIQKGDLVETVDHGPQIVRWIGSSRKAAQGKSAPIRIPAGTFGQGTPKRPLFVSPQHRILIRSEVARRMFGCAEILLPAKKLVGLAGIEEVTDGDAINYYHVLFDHHELIEAEGAVAESLLPGPMALRAMNTFARLELLQILGPEGADRYTPARYVPEGRRAKAFVARLKKNNKNLAQVKDPSLSKAMTAISPNVASAQFAQQRSKSKGINIPLPWSARDL